MKFSAQGRLTFTKVYKKDLKNTMYLHVHYRKYAPSLVLKIIPPYWITNYYTDSHKNLSSWVAGFRELKTSSSQTRILKSFRVSSTLSQDLYGNRKYCPWISVATESSIAIGSLWLQNVFPSDSYGKRNYCPWIPMAIKSIALGSLWQEKLLSLDPYGKRNYCPWIPMAREVIVLGSLWQQKVLPMDPYGNKSIAHGSLWHQKYCNWIPIASNAKVLLFDP